MQHDITSLVDRWKAATGKDFAALQAAVPGGRFYDYPHPIAFNRATVNRVESVVADAERGRAPQHPPRRHADTPGQARAYGASHGVTGEVWD